MPPFSLGSLKIDCIQEYCSPIFPPEQFLVGLPTDALDRNIDWLAPTFYDVARRMVVMSIHSWVVRTPHHTVLIDTCYGNDKDRPGTPGNKLASPWIAKLAALGLQPEDIDFVLCTHLHADHIGWNTKLVDGRWVPTFPNARYIFGRREYNHWNPATRPSGADTQREGAFKDSVLPCMEAGLASLVDGGFAIGDNLRVEDAPGHTEGTVLIRADSDGQSGLFVGDIIHMPLQVVYPDVNSLVCQLPDQARATRRRVLSDCAENESLLLPAHFPSPHCGHVTRKNDSFHFHAGHRA